MSSVAACGPTGTAPQIDPVDDQVAYVGIELTLPLRASDMQHDGLMFAFRSNVPDLGDRAQLRSYGDGSTAIFSWTPVASDVGTWSFDFIVTDGTHNVTETVTIDVKDSTGKKGAPIFRAPLGSGTTLDLAHASCIDVNVVIDDADSSSVNITQEGTPIDGATLDPTGPLDATWHFCPTEAQIAASSRYLLVLGADDGQNPKTIKNYLIVLHHAPEAGCPGRAPVVDHTPADASTSSDVTITANVADDTGLMAAPLVYTSTTAPGITPDLGTMTPVAMALSTGDLASGTWTATIPNPTSGAGTSATLYYVIVAEDDDDPSGITCDHVTQSPSTGAYQMTVTNPGGGVCIDDAGEPDDTTASARRVDYAVPSMSSANQICAWDDDWYRVYFFAGETIHTTIAFTQANAHQDLDLHIYKASIDQTPCTEADPTTCQTSNGQGSDSNESMTFTVPTDGYYYVVVHGWDGAENSYDICIGLSAVDCPTLP